MRHGELHPEIWQELSPGAGKEPVNKRPVQEPENEPARPLCKVILNGVLRVGQIHRVRCGTEGHRVQKIGPPQAHDLVDSVSCEALPVE